jgi:hypothetical protein
MKPLGRYRRSLDDNIKMYIKELCFEVVNGTKLPQGEFMTGWFRG